MKKYIIIISVFSLVFLSCEDFLSHVPKSVLTPENAYSNPNDWHQNLNAAYATLQDVFVGHSGGGLAGVGGGA